MQSEQQPVQNEVGRAVESVLKNYVGFIIDNADLEHIKNEVLLEAQLGLVGLRQTAEILGVSPQRIAQLEEQAKMPEPAAIIESGQRSKHIWLEIDILNFAKKRQATRTKNHSIQHFVRQSIMERQNLTED